MVDTINGKFVAIPIKTMKSKAWKAFSPSIRCVYQTMLMKYVRNDNPYVTWSQTELSDISGICVRTVKSCLAELRNQNWIEVKDWGCRWASGTTYWINPKYSDW